MDIEKKIIDDTNKILDDIKSFDAIKYSSRLIISNKTIKQQTFSEVFKGV